MSREFRNLVATMLLTLAGFLVIRQLVTSDAVAFDWPLPFILALVGLVLALLPERAAAMSSPVAVTGEPSRMPQVAADDLTLIKGIGPQRARTLAQAGCPRYGDLARLSESELGRMLEDVGAVAPICGVAAFLDQTGPNRRRWQHVLAARLSVNPDSRRRGTWVTLNPRPRARKTCRGCRPHPARQTPGPRAAAPAGRWGESPPVPDTLRIAPAHR